MPNVRHYTEIGGYPLFYYVRSDDGHLHACPSCVNQNRVGRNVLRCEAHINYEDNTLTCDVCEKTINPAYED